MVLIKFGIIINKRKKSFHQHGLALCHPYRCLIFLYNQAESSWVLVLGKKHTSCQYQYSICSVLNSLFHSLILHREVTGIDICCHQSGLFRFSPLSELHSLAFSLVFWRRWIFQVVFGSPGTTPGCS